VKLREKVSKMRRCTILTTLALALSFIVCTQLVTTRAGTNAIPADVDIDPDALLLGSQGKWITAYVSLPEGYDVNTINGSSVTLQVMGSNVSVSRYNIEGSTLIAKFDRALVTNLLLSLIVHMSPHVKQKVSLTVMGSLYDGKGFQGSDTIEVFFTQI